MSTDSTGMDEVVKLVMIEVNGSRDGPSKEKPNKASMINFVFERAWLFPSGKASITGISKAMHCSTRFVNNGVFPLLG